MAYSKSYLFLGLNLFVFLSSQVLADIHVPPMLTVDPNLPSIRSVGLNPTNFGLMVGINKSDADGNGNIDFTEEELLIAFYKPDTDHNGFVSASELHYFLTNVGIKATNEEVEEFVRRADVDGDGQLSFNEFVKHGRFSGE